jgi:hypothetical protein
MSKVYLVIEVSDEYAEPFVEAYTTYLEASKAAAYLCYSYFDEDDPDDSLLRKVKMFYEEECYGDAIECWWEWQTEQNEYSNWIDIKEVEVKENANIPS